MPDRRALLRQHLADEHIKDIAALLGNFLSRKDVRTLRRELSRRGR